MELNKLPGAFWRNDPFYPRPRCGCSIWQAFQEHYLQVSRQIAASDLEVSLSRLFIEKVSFRQKYLSTSRRIVGDRPGDQRLEDRSNSSVTFGVCFATTRTPVYGNIELQDDG
ncbi:hypothetical protein GB937_007940 [Aspergillus fischeri]|nr:hypothetical protein GB937_007940 [Aspergillus fischeri]